MHSRLTVGVIFGGRSGEHEVSLQSAATVIAALRDRHDVKSIGIAHDGTWLLDGDPLGLLKECAQTHQPVSVGAGPTTVVSQFPGTEVVAKLDVVIPLVHGTYGEDGSLQGLLELAQIPYVGAGVLASAIGMDKAVMKDIFRQHGIPVVESLVVLRKQCQVALRTICALVEHRIGYPCFVKPANLGSSVGVSKVHSADGLPQALREAARYDRKIVIERAVSACREIEVAILGNDDPEASVPGEIIPCHEFYDYAAKYVEEGSQLIIPAQLSPEQAARIRELSIAAFKALDCSGMARVDSFVSGIDGQVWVNEVNTIPGFTRNSMYPRLWAQGGLDLPDLLDRLIELAIERFEDRSSSRTSYDLT